MKTRAISMIALVSATSFLPGPTAGQELRGSIAIEARSFPQSPGFTEQKDATLSPSLLLAPELLWDAAGGDLQLTVEPFLRLDRHDANRTHFDVREASALYFSDRWALFAGVGRVFWGKTEARHLVDIVNQTDGVEDVDAEDKLGQPMLNLTIETDWGALDFFYLPYFRERTFPSGRGRLRGPLPVLDAPTYDADSNRWHPDVAARWSHYIGDLDVALSAFRGTSREPRLRPDVVDAGLGLRPHYDVIDQIGVEAQWTRGATLWKLEAMTRGGHSDRFAAAVVGVEHTLFGVGGSTSDLGLLSEFMLDGRDDAAPFTAFDRDVFVGVRWAMNDESDTSVLGGPVIDLETGEVLAFMEVQRRMAERWSLDLEARWFANTNADGALFGLSRDDFVTVRVSRHF